MQPEIQLIREIWDKVDPELLPEGWINAAYLVLIKAPDREAIYITMKHALRMDPPFPPEPGYSFDAPQE